MKSILIIDDDADILDMLSRMLSQAEYQVFQARNEAEALQLITEDTALDAAIVDFWLGLDSSLPILDALTEKRFGFPIMVVSGGDGEMPIEVSHSLSRLSGAVSFLQKPFTRRDLLSKVEEMLS